MVPILTEFAGIFGPQRNCYCRHIWSLPRRILQAYQVPPIDLFHRNIAVRKSYHVPCHPFLWTIRPTTDFPVMASLGSSRCQFANIIASLEQALLNLYSSFGQLASISIRKCISRSTPDGAKFVKKSCISSVSGTGNQKPLSAHYFFEPAQLSVSGFVF